MCDEKKGSGSILDTRKKRQQTERTAVSNHDQNQKPIPPGEDQNTLLQYYYQMFLIRHFEEKAGEMYTKAKIGGYCHLNLGQEPTVVGFCTGLDAQDYVNTNYLQPPYALGRRTSP